MKKTGVTVEDNSSDGVDEYCTYKRGQYILRSDMHGKNSDRVNTSNMRREWGVIQAH